MEAAGLGVGVIGLVSLFGTCLDILERWDAYKNFGFESGSIKARFIADQVRFRKWGQRVGIGIGQGQAISSIHPALENPLVCSAVDIILHSIKDIDGDAKKHASYLTSVSDSTGSPSESNIIIPNGHVHIDKMQGISSRRDKLSWALRGKARALTLVGSFETLVQKLYDLVPLDSISVKDQIAAEEAQSSTDASIGSVNKWQDNAEKILLDLEKQIYNECRRDICDWLGAPDMKRIYDEFNLRRLIGTCDWVFHRTEFHQWWSLDPGNPEILWIYGPPGYGKTILCARLIEHMSANFQIRVGYFFMSSEIESRENPFLVMRSWVAQLISQAQQAFDMTQEKWETSDSGTASEIEIQELFNTLVQNLPPCVFIVDGLDECTGTEDAVDPNHKRSLFDFLRFLTTTIYESKSRLLIVSRNDLRIREGLSLNSTRTKRGLVELQISPKDVEADANIFSKSIVSRKLSNKSEEQQEALSKRLVDRCESMFLAIKLLEDDLRGGKNLKQLQRAIDEAPNKLDRIYDRDWERINRLENSSRRRAFSILRWATFALRPLTVPEITECLLIPDEENGHIDYEELPDCIDEIYIKTEILELCGSLVEIRAEPNSALDRSTIHLTHFSVKQYILSHMPIEPSALIANEQLRSMNEAIQNNVLAKYCLRYLNCDDTWKGTPSDTSSSMMTHAFRKYSTGLWWRHVECGVSNSEEVLQLINSFFRPPNPNWESWRRNYISYVMVETWILDGERVKDFGDPLYYASLFQLTETVEYLINEVEQDTEHGYSSSSRSSLATLLTEHASSTAKPWEGATISRLTPLHAASYSGNIGIMKLLLTAGADLGLQDDSGWAPLHLASYHGHSEAVKLLLKDGASIGLQTNDGSSPLLISAAHGHAQVVKLLLDNGAMLNEPDDLGWTPLASACCHGYTEVARLLLENGADVRIETNFGWTPLILASRYGHMEVVRLIPNNGSYLDEQTADGLTALNLASYHGHFDTVEVLLNNGANVDVADSDGWTPLASAAANGYVSIVKLLLENRANVNMANLGGWTPLATAAAKGHVDTVKLLLDNGADSNATPWPGQTALIKAIEFGYIDVVKFFLESNHSIDSIDHLGCSLLTLAVESQHLNIVEYLLQRGASPDSKDITGRSPLFFAALTGNIVLFDIVSSESSDSVNTRDVYGSTILSLAVRHGHVDLVARLLSRPETLLNSRDRFGRLVSFWANTPSIFQNITETAVRRGILLETSNSTAPMRLPEMLGRLMCDTYVHPDMDIRSALEALCWATDSGNSFAD
ncbi:hypothetical protein FHL15_005361 [Xylaria flabelliformis]|uniref:Uncharacterized protein n=1 Tax=Xylaria flabelliformis TaxID=2512241 RepID=A0A553I0I0_9PEZI|nr:hypothetical protein FHL15_005361 [Xylaria flabelliformis]